MNFDDIHFYAKNLSVLYVENDADVRDSIGRLLENSFLTVDVAVDGNEGLERYNTMLECHRYDLVISDVSMPHLSSLKMAKLIRQKYDEQAIILITAYNNSEFFIDAIKIGINAYLLKPVNLDELSKVLFQTAKNIGFYDRTL